MMVQWRLIEIETEKIMAKFDPFDFNEHFEEIFKKLYIGKVGCEPMIIQEGSD